MRRCLCHLPLLAALILAGGRTGFAFPPASPGSGLLGLSSLVLIEDNRPGRGEGRGEGRGGRDWGGRGEIRERGEMRERGDFRAGPDRGDRREGFDRGDSHGLADRGDPRGMIERGERRIDPELGEPRGAAETHGPQYEEMDKPKIRRGIGAGAGFWGGPYWGYGPRWGHACEACRSACEGGGEDSYCERCRIRCGW
jgi:hypothetical protein